MNSSVIIVGAGYAGLLTANRALVRGHQVTLVNERDVFVDRIRLHEVVAGRRAPERTTRTLRRSTRARLVTGRAARVEEGRVDLDDGRTLTADHVVLATGSGGATWGWDWAQTRRAEVAALSSGARVVVNGAGLTGIECASEIAQARPDLAVTLVDPEPVGRALAPAGRAHLERRLERLGVAVTTQPTSGDLVLDCTGLRADPLAAASGLATTASGQVLVDRHLRVPGAERLWAAGDAAAVVGQPHLRPACASAVPMGALLADQLGRADRREPLRPVSIGFAAWCVSLGRGDGLVQYVRRDDTVTPRVTVGRPAAVVKELVCRLAAVAPRRGVRWYRELEGPA